MLLRNLRRIGLPCALLAASALSAAAQPALETFANAKLGVSDPFPLTDDTALVVAYKRRPLEPGVCRAAGPRALYFVEDLGSAPWLKRLRTPYFHPVLRLTATRVLGARPGADLEWDTADDELVKVDDLGGRNHVSVVPDVAPFAFGTPWRRVDDATVLLETTDGTTLVGGLDGEATIEPLDPILEGAVFLTPTRYLRWMANSLPAERALFLFDRTSGAPPFMLDPMGKTSEAQRVSGSRAISFRREGDSFASSFTLYKDLDGSPSSTDHELPFAPSPGDAVALSADRWVLQSEGTDSTYGTADDQLLVISGLLSEPSAIAVSVPFLRPASGPVAVAPDAVAIRTKAGAGPAGTDDRITLVTGLDGTPDVVSLAVGLLALHPHDPTPVGPRQLVMPTLGVDAAVSADDELALITDIGGTNALSHVLAGGMGGHELQLTPLAPGAVMAPTLGAELHAPSDDDEFSIVTGIGDSPAVTRLPLPFGFRSYASGNTPRPIGNGRALDSIAFDGAPDEAGLNVACQTPLHLVTGLPGGLVLEAQQLSLRVPANGDAEASVTARLVLPDPAALVAADVTLRVGNVAQSLSAAAFTPTANGWRYEDPTGAQGFFRLVEYDAVAQTLVVQGSGAVSKSAKTRPRNLVLSLESTELRVAQALDAVRRRGALVLPTQGKD